MTHAEHAPDHYYVPTQSHWPIIATISLFTLMLGGATPVSYTHLDVYKRQVDLRACWSWEAGGS